MSHIVPEGQNWLTQDQGIHKLSVSEWKHKDWYLLGLSSLWLIWWLSLWLIWEVSCANLSQSQPPWNFQLCTPPPPPPVVTRSQKPPAPETIVARPMVKRATISRSAEHGMMPARGWCQQKWCQQGARSCAWLRWVAGIGKVEMAIVSLCHWERNPMIENVVVKAYLAPDEQGCHQYQYTDLFIGLPRWSLSHNYATESGSHCSTMSLSIIISDYGFREYIQFWYGHCLLMPRKPKMSLSMLIDHSDVRQYLEIEYWDGQNGWRKATRPWSRVVSILH